MEIISSAFIQIGNSLALSGQVLEHTWFIALPPIFYLFFKILWLYHIQDKYFSSLTWTLLEIIPPKNIEKSFKPMEALFAGFAGVEKTFNQLEINLDGALTDIMSLELVSDEGNVHFYIRTLKKHRSLVESHIYAQYPDVGIVEVPDYVDDIPRIVPNSQWDLWGADLEFTKHDAYPIRTYPKFEESVTGKMIDPLAGLVETMGKIGPGQKMWLQWVIYPAKPSWGVTEGKKILDKLKGREEKKEEILKRLWKDIMDVFSNLIIALTKPVEFKEESKKEEQPLEFRLSPGEREVLKAIEDNLGKLQFFTKGRFIYVGRRENFDRSLGVTSFFGGIKQFNDENLNGFKPGSDTKTVSAYFFKESRLRYRQRKILRRYRSRSMDGFKMTLSSEELATVFHLPDMSVVAPSITRVEAKRGGAPANLPVE
jgi:hypothetical protein